jgi:hypothetical protein
MQKWLRIQDGVAFEETDVDPAGRFHPDLQWVPAGKAQVGWIVDESGVLVAPVAPWPATGARSLEVLAELQALDAASIRCLRVLVGATGAEAKDQKSRLADLETKAAVLRVELAGLTA